MPDVGSKPFHSLHPDHKVMPGNKQGAFTIPVKISGLTSLIREKNTHGGNKT